MGARLRGVAVVVVVLAVGALLGSAAEQWWRGGGGPERPEPVPSGPASALDERVRVEVLNGAGEAGWARRATGWLRDRGFDVVDYGNADSFDHETSVVMDRVGRPDFARAVADALGITRVRSEPDATLYLDVSVVLGEDWELPAPAPASTEEPPWWDLRRFFPEAGEPGGSTTPGRLADPGESGSGEG